MHATLPRGVRLKHTALIVVELTGVDHVLCGDPGDDVANYAKNGPLKPQLVSAWTGSSTSSE